MTSILVSGLKQLYSGYVSAVSRLSVTKRLKKQVVYLLSFPNNDHDFIVRVSRDYPVVVCYTKSCQHEALELERKGISIYPLETVSGLTKSIRRVTQSKIVICDNYFAFLGDIQQSNNQTIIQLWHATGAIKQFGFEDKQIQGRRESDKRRFARVYQSFDAYIVGSKAMGDVFKRSYGAKESQMYYLGFPRTDAFAQQITHKPENKQCIVYLPTYRETGSTPVLLDVATMKKHLADQYTLSVKYHPHVDISTAHLESDEFVTYVDSHVSPDTLLKKADVLVTDYSSTAFDYALAHPTGRLLFYWYDESDYDKTIGIQPNVAETFPFPVCHTLDELLTQIESDETGNMEAFNQTWNTYHDGAATERCLEMIRKKMGDSHDL